MPWSFFVFFRIEIEIKFTEHTIKQGGIGRHRQGRGLVYRILGGSVESGVAAGSDHADGQDLAARHDPNSQHAFEPLTAGGGDIPVPADLLLNLAVKALDFTLLPPQALTVRTPMFLRRHFGLQGGLGVLAPAFFGTLLFKRRGFFLLRRFRFFLAFQLLLALDVFLLPALRFLLLFDLGLARALRLGLTSRLFLKPRGV